MTRRPFLPALTSALLILSIPACDRARPRTDSSRAPPTSPPPATATTPPSSRPVEPPANVEAFRKVARDLTDRYQQALKQALLTALAEGGPTKAIEVCSTQAPEIAESVAGEVQRKGITVARTALRVRNPDNAPTHWQRPVLTRFAEQLPKGKPPPEAPLEWSELADGTLRYMRAIPMGAMCLTCHGKADDLAAPVKAALAARYPQDQATGFSPGELRGAFVVTAPLVATAP